MDFIEVMNLKLESPRAFAGNKVNNSRSENGASFNNALNSILKIKKEKNLSLREKNTDTTEKKQVDFDYNSRFDKINYNAKKEIKKTEEAKEKEVLRGGDKDIKKSDRKDELLDIEELEDIYGFLQNEQTVFGHDVLQQLIELQDASINKVFEGGDLFNTNADESVFLSNGESTDGIEGLMEYISRIREAAKENNVPIQFNKISETKDIEELKEKLKKIFENKSLILEKNTNLDNKSDDLINKLKYPDVEQKYKNIEDLVKDEIKDNANEKSELFSKESDEKFHTIGEKTNKALNAKEIEENYLIINKEQDTVTKIKSQRVDITKKPENVEKNLIMNQIIKKIKFVTTDRFSELKIQLKPENLGKLLLKIALEKGEITAKFTAENNHIKEIIESNFSELKGSLQEKGINVQNLSVSVGNEDRPYNEKNKQKKNPNRELNLKKMNMDEVDFGIESNNPYFITEGILDIKA